MIDKGHEIWLETEKTGREVFVKAGWGHAMKSDGVYEKEKCNAYLITPSNRRLQLYIDDLRFKVEEEGVYIVVVEYNFGIGSKLKDGSFKRGLVEDAAWRSYFYQYAKTLIPVNSEVYDRNIGNILEIIFLDSQLKVVYEKKPLPNQKVECTYKSYEGRDFPITTTTNRDGIANISLDNDLWLFKVSYTDETKKTLFYDNTKITSTLTVKKEVV